MDLVILLILWILDTTNPLDSCDTTNPLDSWDSCDTKYFDANLKAAEKGVILERIFITNKRDYLIT